MKIIKDGNLRRFNMTKRFECPWCGCVFEADKNEYKIHDDQKDGPWIEVHCPFCKTRLTPTI